MLKNKEKIKKVLIIFLIIIMSGIIFFYQTKKVGLHEDESYSLCTSVNPNNGVIATQNKVIQDPIWRTKEYFQNAFTLTPNNILNFKALYLNQAYDNHPPFFYILVHFATLFFSGQFSMYSIFIVNIISYVTSCLIISKILKLLNKKKLIIPSLILYGLSMGTISMVIFQRMYMLLTLFILLYFYLNVKLYKNNFTFNKNFTTQLGITTVLGFLTHYYFAIYAFFILGIILIEMIKTKKDKKIILKYIILHIIYAIIGILTFVPCIKHLLFSDRGLNALGNTGYSAHLFEYLKHLAYAFSINNSNVTVIIIALVLFAISTIALYVKSKEKFIILITILPSIFYYFIVAKMTSFQELRYIMPIIPFVILAFFFILNEFIPFKYNYILFCIIALVFVTNGIIFSKPLFLYENYKNILNIAEENKNKSFVYIYDNSFNHMQSVSEMMIYNKTLIININNNDLHYVINNDSLNNEDSYVLSIKSYMDNDLILNKIKEESNFKNIVLLYNIDDDNNSKVVMNNLYLVSK